MHPYTVLLLQSNSFRIIYNKFITINTLKNINKININRKLVNLIFLLLYYSKIIPLRLNWNPFKCSRFSPY